MGFASIDASDRVRPERIFPRRSWFQVGRIDAESPIANVVKLHSLGNHTVRKLVSIAMNEFLRLFSSVAISFKAKHAVPASTHATFPQPTGSRLFNLCPKPFRRVFPCAYLHPTMMQPYTPHVKNNLTMELNNGS
jgi:hypothetical protein